MNDPFASVVGARRGPDASVGGEETQFDLAVIDAFLDRVARDSGDMHSRREGALQVLAVRTQPMAVLADGEVRIRGGALDAAADSVRLQLRRAAADRGLGVVEVSDAQLLAAA